MEYKNHPTLKRELEVLTEEIKKRCLYGNGKPEKLGKKHKEH
jgi:hypothetical protein